MSFFDLLSTSFTNLYQRKARTLLTILGVIIGTMSIVLMIALGEGSTQAFIEQISQNTDLTKIEVYQSYSSNPNDSGKLDDKTVKSLEDIPNVTSVIPAASVQLYIESPRYASELYLQAVPLEKIQNLYSDKLEWGSISKSSDYNVYLGKDLISWSFYQKQPGKILWEMPMAENPELENEKFTVYLGSSYYYTESENGLDASIVLPKGKNGKVAGVFAQTGGELDYNGYIDLDILKNFIKENKSFAEAAAISADYSYIQVYTDDMNSVEEVLNQIKNLGFNAYSPMEYIKQMQEESQRQQAQWGAVGAIALIVSAIGIINTMMTSIMERKREIGVLKVLGCSLGNINAMFLIEAAIIGMLGGFIGVLLSYGVSALVTLIPASPEGGSFLGSFFGGSVRFVIKPIIGVAAIVGSALIGMLAGIYPSVRAMKMSPLAALRDE